MSNPSLNPSLSRSFNGFDGVVRLVSDALGHPCSLILLSIAGLLCHVFNPSFESQLAAKKLLRLIAFMVGILGFLALWLWIKYQNRNDNNGRSLFLRIIAACVAFVFTTLFSHLEEEAGSKGTPSNPRLDLLSYVFFSMVAFGGGKHLDLEIDVGLSNYCLQCAFGTALRMHNIHISLAIAVFCCSLIAIRIYLVVVDRPYCLQGTQYGHSTTLMLRMYNGFVTLLGRSAASANDSAQSIPLAALPGPDANEAYANDSAQSLPAAALGEAYANEGVPAQPDTLLRHSSTTSTNNSAQSLTTTVFIIIVLLLYYMPIVRIPCLLILLWLWTIFRGRGTHNLVVTPMRAITNVTRSVEQRGQCGRGFYPMVVSDPTRSNTNLSFPAYSETFKNKEA